MFEKYLTFIKSHEKLLLTIIVLAFSLIAFNKWINHSAEKADVKAAVAEARADAEKEKSVALEKIVGDMRTTYDSQRRENEAEKTLLLSAISKRDRETDERKKADAVLAPSDLASRWRYLLGTQIEGDVKADASGAIAVSGPAAHATVAKLEDIPRLTADLDDQRKVNEADKRTLASLTSLTSSLTDTNAQLHIQLASDADACKAEKDKLRADARKSKRGWFISGVVVGWAGHAALKKVFGF